MNNNELASLLGTIIAVLGDIPEGNAKEQIYRAASKATAEAGFGITFMADTQNELYRAYTKKPEQRPILPIFPDFLEALNSREKDSAQPECGCPTCLLRKRLEGRATSGVVSISGADLVAEMKAAGYEQGNPLLDFFNGIVKKGKEREKAFNDFGRYCKNPVSPSECYEKKEEKPPVAIFNSNTGNHSEKEKKEYFEKHGRNLYDAPPPVAEPNAETKKERPTNITDTLGSGED